MNRRTLLLGFAAVLLGACTSAPSAPASKGADLTLVSAFQGRSTGTGHFRVWLTGEERRFTAQLNGTVTGRTGRRTLKVVEDFAYDDGQKDRLTWVFTESGPGTWRGKREDTVGEATVTETGGEIRLSYTADFRSPSGVTRLGFEDVIFARSDGAIVNDGIVSRAGLPIAAVRFVIRRG